MTNMGFYIHKRISNEKKLMESVDTFYNQQGLLILKAFSLGCLYL